MNKPLFEEGYCVVCFHANHPGYACIVPIPYELFEILPPYLATCGCIEPTSEKERGERIVTLGSCDVCNHQNHTGYGKCWSKESLEELGGRITYILCECVQ
jgi:hypothetical protein